MGIVNIIAINIGMQVFFQISDQKRQLMPFVVTWMELDKIMLAEIRRRKVNTEWASLYVGHRENKQKHKK